ncbi:hypothetical protein CKM354_000058400 [Cercospora kikuchii]|uniref:Uncharacterized protein n=1 Tax=Cercospora kikuchii TaxID=84275 RepID=A0A9P3FC15_9PEZI|nr:uncharacterized protein CKM354_000058400 [Cercospora kikuchii]GIZ37125.1 hypothetical protein CKM354_000058400 [Cercospora kikuchii]
MSRNGTSPFEVSAPLSLSSGPDSNEYSSTDRKPDLERHISHIPQDSDLEDASEEETAHDTSGASGGGSGIKSKLKKLKNRVTHHSHDKGASSAVPTDPTDRIDKRQDSGNATSDFEITPGLGGVSSVSNTGGDYLTASSAQHSKAITPNLERHISSIGPDGTLSTNTASQQQPKGRSPKMERHISGIPQDDYDSDREI